MLNEVEITELKKLGDNRGFFIKTMTNSMIGKYPAGEIYLSVASPGVERGNHYHKKATEWFSVIKGKCKITLNYKGEEKIIRLDANEPKTVKVPPLITHKFINIGSEDCYLLAFTDVDYDPEDTIS